MHLVVSSSAAESVNIRKTAEDRMFEVVEADMRFCLPTVAAVLLFMSGEPRNLRDDACIMSIIAAICAILSARFPLNESLTVVRQPDSFLTALLGNSISQTSSPLVAACSIFITLLDNIDTSLDSLLRVIYRMIPLETEKNGLPTSDLSHHLGYGAIRAFVTAVTSSRTGSSLDVSPVLKSAGIDVYIEEEEDSTLRALCHVFQSSSTGCAVLVFLLQHTVVPIASLVSLLLSWFPSSIPADFTEDRQTTSPTVLLRIACDIVRLLRAKQPLPIVPDLTAATRSYLLDLTKLRIVSPGLHCHATALLSYADSDLLAWTSRCSSPVRQRPPPTRPSSLLPVSTEQWDEEVVLRTGQSRKRVAQDGQIRLHLKKRHATEAPSSSESSRLRFDHPSNNTTYMI